MIGTDAHGHTFPGATVPFGMVQLSPDTRVQGWDACAGYHYSDSTLLGFSHTHLSGTGIADYGDILVTPTTTPVTPVRVVHKFSHKEEYASPGYYRVRLENDLLAELTATTHAGLHRYTFPPNDTARIIIDLHHGLGPDRVRESWFRVVGNDEIAGLRRSEGWAKDQYVFFVAKFSKPFARFGSISDGRVVEHLQYAKGIDLRCFLEFSRSENSPLLVKVGISSVSVENARRNLETEISGWDFDLVQRSAEAVWEKELSKIEIEGGTEEQRTTFTTALYHAMLAPNILSDVDGRYRGMDGTIHTADGFQMYSVFSLWDTFRAEHPLLTIIDSARTTDFIRSLLAKYDEAGTLPVWELASNETWTMIGYHAVPVIVDAYMKGIRAFDAKHALRAMKYSAMLDHHGLKAYRKYGYIPGDADGESVSKTLEYAYDDWCIARFAEVLGDTAAATLFGKRAKSFENLFDPMVGFMRPKENATWVDPFDPTSVTFHYTEANPWQYSFFVPHDIPGLIRLMGGREKFIRRLDSLFLSTAPVTGRSQADISGLIGQYAQGNEPSHNFAYLYNYAGVPWKTASTVRVIMDSLFDATPAGLCGNDDCGQMSAWYVMSSIGLYPVTPGDPVYSIGSPLFPKVTLHLENGKRFIIESRGVSHEAKYIGSAQLNGRAHNSTIMSHEEIIRGGTLELSMTSLPGASWGTDVGSSLLSSDRFAPVPYIRGGRKSFLDSTIITLGTVHPGSIIRYKYTSGGGAPEFQSYEQPLRLTRSGTLEAFIISPPGASPQQFSDTIVADYIKRSPVGAMTLESRYSTQYTGGGDDALLDGIRGALNFRLGAWQGYEQVDLQAVIDLGASKNIQNLSVGCLQDIDSWIFFPSAVEFSFSNDGVEYHDVRSVESRVSPHEMLAQIKEFSVMENFRARYIRINAKNVGTCPEWHKGAGGKAWLFVDEVTVSTY